MPQHRGLTRKKFVDAVGHELLQEYLDARIELPDISGELTDEIVDDLLNEQSTEVRTTIQEEFYCINDVADRGMDYLERACQNYDVPLDPDWPRERVAMCLFLERPAAFRTAYDWYLWRTAANSMSHHQFFDVTHDFSGGTRDLFRDELDAWFSQAKKGSSPNSSDGAMCEVRSALPSGRRRPYSSSFTWGLLAHTSHLEKRQHRNLGVSSRERGCDSFFGTKRHSVAETLQPQSQPAQILYRRVRPMHSFACGSATGNV